MISIIVPNYNSEKTISRCLNSIFWNYAQDYEVIVVDDFSSDDSVNIIKKFPTVKLIEHSTNRKPSAARNTGANVAKGEILLFVDSDVAIYRYTLTKIADSFRNKDIVALIGTPNREITYPNLCSIHFNRRINFNYQFLPDYINIVYGAICAIRKDVFQKVGGFNELLFGVEDSELGYRISKLGKIYFDRTLVFKHYKYINFWGLLKNDIKRTLHRMKFLLGKEKIINVIKNRRFLTSPFYQLISPLLALLFFCSLWNIYLASFFLTVFLLVNLKYILYNKDQGLIFMIKLFFLLLIDMFVVSLAIMYGYLKGEKY